MFLGGLWWSEVEDGFVSHVEDEVDDAQVGDEAVFLCKDLGVGLFLDGFMAFYYLFYLLSCKGAGS